jgi:hypothetical protein
MKLEVKERKYRLLNSVAPSGYILKVGRAGDLVHFDKELNTPRAIRHCPNEPEVFIDKQSDFAYVEPIEFNDGFLVVESHKTSTQKFLSFHPDNGRIFEEINEGKEAEEEIELEELVIGLKQEVRDKAKDDNGVYELQALASSLLGSVARTSNMTTPELKREVYIHIDRNPHRFLDSKNQSNLFDSNIERLHIALLALDEDHVKITPNKKSIAWGSSGNIITNIPSGYKPLEHFSAFLATNEGILVLEQIKKLGSYYQSEEPVKRGRPKANPDK